jgi:hypothetical protein
VIPFIAKTWFLWWALAQVLVLYWLHALFARNKPEDIDRLARESEEEAAYIAFWQLNQKVRAISLSLLGADRGEGFEGEKNSGCSLPADAA